jgi:hypothetical protein
VEVHAFLPEKRRLENPHMPLVLFQSPIKWGGENYSLIFTDHIGEAGHHLPRTAHPKRASYGVNQMTMRFVG